ncbi:23S rRNA (uracil(1939)-C(5))-methyltransferase RlmD [Mycoplasma sp. Sp33II]|uniref:23S rRNA (uracil(1939)-C(5))-methyltransferase RlmD n=1 Tax=unclassified Mycoplasma TaxID=2683645 RepID=UPI003AAA9CDC
MPKLRNYKINDTLQVTCSELSYEGLGISRLDDGYAIFTSDLFPSESANVTLVKVTSKYAFAKVEKLLTKSPQRNLIVQDCINSAPLINLQYTSQIQFKNDYFSKLLSWNLGPKVLENYSPFQASPVWQNYRNKVRYPFLIVNQKLHVAEYDIKSNDLHIANNFDQNLPIINQTVEFLLDSINTFFTMSKKNNAHMFEELTIRSNNKNELSVAVKINSDYDIPSKLLQQFKTNPAIIDFNVIKKDKIINLYNIKPFTMYLNNKEFNCTISSFFQVNTTMAEIIFKKIAELVDQIPSNALLDAYCGVGVIGQLVGTNKLVIGSDITPSAILDAKINAANNQINGQYFVGDSASVFKKHVKSLADSILVLDPPRSGITPEFITWIKQNKIQNVIYMSCDPKTLVRDLKELSSDYAIKYIQGFDMFPNTAHIESVTLLSYIQK